VLSARLRLGLFLLAHPFVKTRNTKLPPVTEFCTGNFALCGPSPERHDVDTQQFRRGIQIDRPLEVGQWLSAQFSPLRLISRSVSRARFNTFFERSTVSFADLDSFSA
jgi:hypothetical protein